MSPIRHQPRDDVAQRTLAGHVGSIRLPSTLGWDSHNYVTMAIDSAGFIHVSGNMHGVPLVYFRRTQANDAAASSAHRWSATTSSPAPTRCSFTARPEPGVQLSRRLQRQRQPHLQQLQPAPRPGAPAEHALLDGKGRATRTRSGRCGPDAWWHMVWVWRDTPDAETNHDISYAKSRDLVSWQRADGQAVTLPSRSPAATWSTRSRRAAA